MNDLIPTDLQEFGDEARVQDLRLGEVLGYADPKKVRKLIRSNQTELSSHGFLTQVGSKMPGAGRGRPERHFMLNEAQAILVTMFSRTGRAAEARRQIVQVFLAWRHGKLVPFLPAVDPEGLPLPESLQTDHLTSQGTRFFKECVRVLDTHEPKEIEKRLQGTISAHSLRQFKDGGSVSAAITKSTAVMMRLTGLGFDIRYILDGVWLFTPGDRAMIEHARTLPPERQAQLIEALRLASHQETHFLN
jgi:hypothetical protein